MVVENVILGTVGILAGVLIVGMTYDSVWLPVLASHLFGSSFNPLSIASSKTRIDAVNFYARIGSFASSASKDFKTSSSDSSLDILSTSLKIALIAVACHLYLIYCKYSLLKSYNLIISKFYSKDSEPISKESMVRPSVTKIEALDLQKKLIGELTLISVGLFSLVSAILITIFWTKPELKSLALQVLISNMKPGSSSLANALINISLYNYLSFTAICVDFLFITLLH